MELNRFKREHSGWNRLVRAIPIVQVKEDNNLNEIGNGKNRKKTDSTQSRNKIHRTQH